MSEKNGMQKKDGMMSRLQMFKAENGSLTARFAKNNELVAHCLHSIYNPEQEADDMLRDVLITEKTVYLVYGFALGYHVKALLQKIPKNSFVCVIEPDKENIFHKLVQDVYSDVSWFSDPRISIIDASSCHIVATKAALLMFEHAIAKLVHVFHYPTMHIFGDAYTKVKNDVEHEMRVIINMMLNFQDTSRKILFKNAWKNFPTILQSAGIAKLKGVLRGIPAIIVSSGPSLEKNVHQLKECDKNAVIIAAGSALGVLKREDVNLSPHFLVAVDPYEIMVGELAPHLDKSITLVVPDTVQNQLLKSHAGKVIFFTSDNKSQPVGSVLEGWGDYIKGDNRLRVSLSVATAAFFLAVHMECEPLIFVGQDLAMSEEFADYYKKIKAEADAKGEEVASVDVSPDAPGHHAKGAGALGWGPQRTYCEVDGNNGRKLLTHKMFKILIDMFNEAFINLRPYGYRAINATEGGAMLRESETITLQKAKRKYLKGNYDIRGKIKNIFKVPIADGINWKELTSAIKRVDKWTDAEYECWKKERDVLVDEKNIALGEYKTKQIENLKLWDDNILTFENSPYYIFVKAYLVVVRWRYWTCLAEEDSYANKRVAYLNLVSEALEVLEVLQGYLHETLGVIEGYDSKVC